jgi:hypothetical protein
MKQHTRSKPRCHRRASRDIRYDCPNKHNHRKAHDRNPIRAIPRQPIRQAAKHKQQAKLDAPQRGPEQHIDRKELLHHVRTVVVQRRPCWLEPGGVVQEPVYDGESGEVQGGHGEVEGEGEEHEDVFHFGGEGLGFIVPRYLAGEEEGDRERHADDEAVLGMWLVGFGDKRLRFTHDVEVFGDVLRHHFEWF